MIGNTCYQPAPSYMMLLLKVVMMSTSCLTRREKLLAAAAALACLGMMASTVSQAETYNFTYVSSAQSTKLSGTFQATFATFGQTLFCDNFTGSGKIGQNSVKIYFGSLIINNSSGFINLSTEKDVGGGFASSTSQGKISGNTRSFSFGDPVIGLFTATDNATAPSSQ